MNTEPSVDGAYFLSNCPQIILRIITTNRDSISLHRKHSSGNILTTVYRDVAKDVVENIASQRDTCINMPTSINITVIPNLPGHLKCISPTTVFESMESFIARATPAYCSTRGTSTRRCSYPNVPTTETSLLPCTIMQDARCWYHCCTLNRWGLRTPRPRHQRNTCHPNAITNIKRRRIQDNEMRKWSCAT